MEIKINLLPPYRKEEIARSNRFKLVVRFFMITLIVFFLFFSFLFGLQKSLSLELNSVSSSGVNSFQASQLEKIKKMDSEFLDINSTVSTALSLERDQLYWDNLYKLLSEKKSEGITVTNLATKDYVVSLAGHADNRDLLTAYKEKLSNESCFSNVNLPLSNLVSKEDISFQMDFKIDKNCLKSKK